MRFCVCDRCGRTRRPHCPLHHHPPKEHQCNSREKRSYHGVCCQCKVNVHKETCRSWGGHCKYTQSGIHTLSKHHHLLPPPHLIFCDLNESWNLLFEHNKKCFAHLSFCTSPPFFPLIQGFTLFFQSCTIPVLNSDYYLKFKDLIRMTDVSHCSPSAL